MLIDAHNIFSEAQTALTTAASTNLIDLGPPAVRDIGVGEELYVVAQVTTAFTDTGSNSTMAVTLETDDSAAFGSATTVMTLGTFAALSAIGTRLVGRLPVDAILERYLRVKYTIANGDLDTGAFTAFLVHGVQAWRAYADNLTIS